MKESQQCDLSNSLILNGVDVCLLPETLLRSYSDKISAKLAKHANTMNQYNSEDLYQAMLKNKTVLAMDMVTNQLFGFAQVKQAQKGEWEFATWVAFAPGIGKPILLSGSSLIHDFEPEAQAIAKVREGNMSPQQAIKEMGGVLIRSETSTTHYNQDSLQPLQKKIFDISFRRLMPSRLPGFKLKSFETEKSKKGIIEAISNHSLVRRLRWLVSSAIAFKD